MKANDIRRKFLEVPVYNARWHPKFRCQWKTDAWVEVRRDMQGGWWWECGGMLLWESGHCTRKRAAMRAGLAAWQAWHDRHLAEYPG